MVKRLCKLIIIVTEVLEKIYNKGPKLLIEKGTQTQEELKLIMKYFTH